MNLSRYRKTATAVVTGAIGWGTEVVNSAPAAITASEWIAGATFLAIALGVCGVPNDQPPASTVHNITVNGGFDDPQAAARAVVESLAPKKAPAKKTAAKKTR